MGVPDMRPWYAVTHFSPGRHVVDVRRNLTRASDAELFRAGTRDAFAEVYDRHVRAVLAWARARIGEHAADLTAEVFARAWLRRNRFRDEVHGSALPWLLGIAQNVLRESLRKQRIEDSGRRRLGLPRSVVRDSELDAVLERPSLSARERRELAKLPPQDRELLRLRVIEERPYREIAAELQCTPQAARLRVSRLLRQLQYALGGQRP